MSEQVKFVLGERDIPTHWVNLMADLPGDPLPPLHPGTKQPAGPEDLAPLFPMALIMQEVSTEPLIEIPDAVRDAYRLWRPTPLYRARRLERALDTPAHIYYKYEGVSPAGSHKPNTAVAQAYENAQAGIRKLTTETGAGQWGSALAFACQLFGLECEVWMVHRFPSKLTNAGRQQADHPTGSLGIAISEAVEVAAQNADTNYSLGSVLNHVLLHQTVIGQEALAQLEMAGEYPDTVIACVGGGSNFGGLTFPFLRRTIREGARTTFIAAEPAACPTLTKGVYAYDFGDTAGFTPLMKMHTLGHEFIPDPVHAGGLRYHGMSPLLSHMYELGLFEAVAKAQRECFAAAVTFARAEGILPAPEPSHAIAAVVEEAKRCAESGEEKVILTALCGHGHFDMVAYERYLSGEMTDYDLPQDRIDAALKNLPAVPGA